MEASSPQGPRSPREMEEAVLLYLRETIETTPVAYFVAAAAVLIPLIFMVVSELSSRATTSRDPQGCRKLGLYGQSNLSDQYNKKYGKGVKYGKDANGKASWKVKALFMYPIKSCHFVELGRHEIISTGMKYDRQFSFAIKEDLKSEKNLASEVEWTFITQRRFPKLVKIIVDVWIPEPKLPDYKPDTDTVKAGGCLVVSFPSYPEITGYLAAFKKLGREIVKIFLAAPRLSFRVPFEPNADQIKKFNLKTHNMKLWSECPEAIDMSPFIAPATLDALKAYLGIQKPLALFRVHPEKCREVYRNAPTKETLGYQPIQGFTDAYPLHINNLASIHDISKRLPDGFGKLDCIRFRSNIYVTGPAAYDEDVWTRIRIGDHQYIVTNHTTRCALPNVNPDDGTVQSYKKDEKKNPLWNEPLRTMRSCRLIDEGAPDSPCLGMHMVSVVPAACPIKVGDEVEVLETGKHCVK